MDHQAYVAARRGRLVEHAIGLGCSPDVAAAEVAAVLEEHRSLIARLADPDPAVRDALERRITGEPEPRRWRLGWGAVVVVALAGLMAGSVLLGRPEQAPPVPSLFGYDLSTATRVLTEAGYAVDSTTSQACEPRGLVLGSDPVPGTEGERGDTVRVRTAVPADPTCLATYGFRSDAWEFVAFVRGGAAPSFAPAVEVYLDGRRQADATPGNDRSAWGGALDRVERIAAAIAPTRSAMPSLSVTSLVPDPRVCGVPVPTPYVDRLALRLEVDPSPDGTEQLCPVTIDLYRDEDSRIEAASIYTGTVQR